VEIQADEERSIYQQAFVTIAAARSADGSGGLFVDGPRVNKIPMRYGDVSETSPAVLSYIYPDHSAFQEARPRRWKLPLFSRAWAFREELLATRVVYYSHGDIVFQCRTLLDCQCGKLKDFHARNSRRTSKRHYQEGQWTSD
jgi:hypothetical protein